MYRPLVSLLVFAVSASAQAQSVGYVLSLRGQWTLDGKVLATDTYHPALFVNNVIARRAGVGTDSDYVRVRLGGRTFTFSCRDNGCIRPFVVRRASGNLRDSETVKRLREAFPKQNVRPFLASNASLADEFQLADGVVRLAAGAAELRPLMPSRIESGLAVLACPVANADCSPEERGASVCDITSSGCNLPVGEEGAYVLKLYRSIRSGGHVTYETTDAPFAIAHVASGERYTKIVAAAEALKREIGEWQDPATPEELRMWQRTLLLTERAK